MGADKIVCLCSPGPRGYGIYSRLCCLFSPTNLLENVRQADSNGSYFSGLASQSVAWLTLLSPSFCLGNFYFEPSLKKKKPDSKDEINWEELSVGRKKVVEPLRLEKKGISYVRVRRCGFLYLPTFLTPNFPQELSRAKRC